VIALCLAVMIKFTHTDAYVFPNDSSSLATYVCEGQGHSEPYQTEADPVVFAEKVYSAYEKAIWHLDLTAEYRRLSRGVLGEFIRSPFRFTFSWRQLFYPSLVHLLKGVGMSFVPHSMKMFFSMYWESRWGQIERASVRKTTNPMILTVPEVHLCPMRTGGSHCVGLPPDLNSAKTVWSDGLVTYHLYPMCHASCFPLPPNIGDLFSSDPECLLGSFAVSGPLKKYLELSVGIFFQVDTSHVGAKPKTFEESHADRVCELMAQAGVLKPNTPILVLGSDVPLNSRMMLTYPTDGNLDLYITDCVWVWVDQVEHLGDNYFDFIAKRSVLCYERSKPPGLRSLGFGFYTNISSEVGEDLRLKDLKGISMDMDFRIYTPVMCQLIQSYPKTNFSRAFCPRPGVPFVCGDIFEFAYWNKMGYKQLYVPELDVFDPPVLPWKTHPGEQLIWTKVLYFSPRAPDHPPDVSFPTPNLALSGFENNGSFIGSLFGYNMPLMSMKDIEHFANRLTDPKPVFLNPKLFAIGDFEFRVIEPREPGKLMRIEVTWNDQMTWKMNCGNRFDGYIRFMDHINFPLTKDRCKSYEEGRNLEPKFAFSPGDWLPGESKRFFEHFSRSSLWDFKVERCFRLCVYLTKARLVVLERLDGGSSSDEGDPSSEEMNESGETSEENGADPPLPSFVSEDEMTDDSF
jgi:hypothetical protein